MSYLINENYVRYECTCGCLMPISRLYFCRHCLKIRCGYCVCHEVDSHYCSNCMEHLSSAEAKVKKNRCNTCFDCPNCFHTLSVRATTRHAEDGSTKAPTKHYYLSCFFCRWTTRDVGIPEQTVASGNWPIKENPHAEKLSSFLEYYKLVAVREKSQREKKTFGPHRRGYTSITDKFGLTSMIARKRAGLPSLPLGGKDMSPKSLPLIKPCEAVEDIKPLPEEFFTSAPDLTKVTTIAQRHSNPMLQPEKTSDLHPQLRQFYIKCSQRCRSCEHNVSKPEYNPGSVKFKIRNAAYYHMPEVRIMTCEPLQSGHTSEIIIKVVNPTQHMTTLQFSPYQKLNEDDNQDLTLSQIRKPICNVVSNTDIDLPSSSIILPKLDDAAEYAEASDTQHFQDDPKVVVWRRGNKAAIKFTITPDKSLEKGTEVIFSFSLEYSYINTMATLESKQPQRSELQANVFVNPGQIVGNTNDD
ncbi:dynactin subunit 4 [Cimex lectularius]|uniref:Dynactin subunit 4 n=1 Tax=Cimex lectularius TaxID=79782 RepID=A0A8I6TCV7_CIMLE|nr:dynactin subunit 4 [Cimex lectularius]